MTIARQIADLVDTAGDVKLTNLDNVPPSDWNTLLNVPGYANTDTRDAANISSGTLASARMGSSTANSGTYLRGDGQWVSNCTNHGNCTTHGNGYSNCSNHGNCGNCNFACACACACACNC